MKYPYFLYVSGVKIYLYLSFFIIIIIIIITIIRLKWLQICTNHYCSLSNVERRLRFEIFSIYIQVGYSSAINWGRLEYESSKYDTSSLSKNRKNLNSSV